MHITLHKAHVLRDQKVKNPSPVTFLLDTMFKVQDSGTFF